MEFLYTLFEIPTNYIYLQILKCKSTRIRGQQVSFLQERKKDTINTIK